MALPFRLDFDCHFDLVFFSLLLLLIADLPLTEEDFVVEDIQHLEVLVVGGLHAFGNETVKSDFDLCMCLFEQVLLLLDELGLDLFMFGGEVWDFG